MKTEIYICPMPIIDNFLQQGIAQMRQSILDIDDSYNNDWDILAELLQNSVDAIRETDRKDGKIHIVVDCQNKIISVKDNGIGIISTELPSLLCLFGTNKKNNEKTIGEKGVGLKFALFSCNDFYIKSCNNSNAIEAIVKDAHNWKSSTEDIKLSLEHNTITPNFDGTEVVLKKLPEIPIFSLKLTQLIFVLRTRTAIGNTLTLWERDDINISITLKYVAPDGNVTDEIIPFRYSLPTDILGEAEKLNIEDYYEYTKTDKDDQQKRLKLKSKVIYKYKSFDHKNRIIKTFSCLVPKWGTWDVLNTSSNLATNEELDNDIFMEEFGYATFQAGIFTSVKGMPTGISIEHPMTGSGGTWAQIFILFEDIKLKFDIGRKSIHGKQKNIYKEYAREIFNEYRSLLKYISGDVNPEIATWDRDEVFNEIDKLIDLKSPNSSFQKKPNGQEATIAAMFFECIGNKKITQITPLIAGYKNKYDLYAKWKEKRIVIEFKAKLYSILKDFKEEIKLFTEINCVVCWDVSEEDEQVFKDAGISLEKMALKSILAGKTDDFPHATHVLRLTGFTSPIYVIDMKSIIDNT